VTDAAVTPDATTGGSVAIIAKSPVDPCCRVAVLLDPNTLVEVAADVAPATELVVVEPTPVAVTLPITELLCAGCCVTWYPATATAAMTSNRRVPAAIVAVFISGSKGPGEEKGPLGTGVPWNS
jgi:hypothetical protein